MKTCLLCQDLAGQHELYPAPPIHTGRFWNIEHNYPTNIRGWAVLVLRRHAAALHELRVEELSELNRLLKKLIPALRSTTGCEKEYIMCFAEGENTKHIHIHVVAKPKGLADEFKAAKIFSLLGIPKERAVPLRDLNKLCQKLQRALKKPSRAVNK